jgi:transcriptional regulator with XRE-family HTH domain
MSNTKLQRAIKNRGLSLKDTSTLSGISTVQLRALIKGHAKNPRLKTIQKLAKALNVKESDLGFFK